MSEGASPLWWPTNIEESDSQPSAEDLTASQRWQPLKNYIAIRECLMCGARSLPYIGCWKSCTAEDLGSHPRTVAFLEKTDTVAAQIYSAATGLGFVKIPEPDREKLLHWLKTSEQVVAKRLRARLNGML